MDINDKELELPWTIGPAQRRPNRYATPLHVASKFDRNERMVQFLLDNGADPDAIDSNGLTAAEAAEAFQKIGGPQGAWALGLGSREC